MQVVVILAGANDLPYSDRKTVIEDLQELSQEIRSYNPRLVSFLLILRDAFKSGPTQTRLYYHTRWIEAQNLILRNYSPYTILWKPPFCKLQCS